VLSEAWSDRPTELADEETKMTEAATITISHAEATDVPAINGVLARAFQDDPVFRWIVPDDRARQETLPGMFGAFTEVYVHHGETYIADGAAAALWVPPGVEPFTEEQGESFGQRMVELLGPAAERGFELNQLLEQHHPQDPCWYLQFVGVIPEHQQRGLGSQLLSTVLDRADAAGAAAYLEATSPDNRRLYERHGFGTVDELRLTHGPPLWPMWREPR
jgi:ribosomal protein S18 acetylase RimI-like enzyme